MSIRRGFPGLLTVILWAAGAGCHKSESNLTPVPSAWSAPSPDTVARVHWLGKRQLGLEAGAYYLLRVWHLPESDAVEKQTLDKLSSAPWRWLYGENQVTNVYRLLLRPLLDDVVREESYLEISRPASLPDEFAFAIRLNDRRAGLWETNLANVVSSLTGVWPTATGHHGWTLRREQQPPRIEMVRAGDWTVIGAGGDENKLLRRVLDQIQHGAYPFGAPPSGRWLEADLDLQRMPAISADGFLAASNLPRISLTLTGDGGNVLTHAELDFPRPLRIEIEPWNIPTNQIAQPLVSLTAIRGLGPALASCAAWNELQIGAPPSQLCCWAPDGIPGQILLGIPLSDGSNQVQALTETLVRRGNPWLTAHGTGKFEPAPDGNGAMWTGLSLIAPCLKAVDDGRWALGAMIPSLAPGTNTPAGLYERPSLAALLGELSGAGETNLLMYDWELTGPRIEAGLYIGQALRLAFHRPLLPTDSTSVSWLSEIRYRLGNCTTRITRTGPNQLAIDRKSTIGLTGAELSLLADWLESPQFPRGLYSLLPPGPGAPAPAQH